MSGIPWQGSMVASSAPLLTPVNVQSPPPVCFWTWKIRLRSTLPVGRDGGPIRMYIPRLSKIMDTLSGVRKRCGDLLQLQRVIGQLTART